VSKTSHRQSTVAGRPGLLALGLLAVIGCGDDGDAGSADNSQSAAGVSAVAGTGTGAAGSRAAGSAAPAAGSGAAAAGSGGAATATFTAVYDAIWGTSTTGRCVTCHGMPASDAANGMLGGIMDKAALHAALVSKPALGGACTGKGMYVVPGSPQTSLLVQKLGAMPPCGSRMPLGGMLTAAELQLINDWIMAGAKND
jgi:hypothetical protein